MQTPLYTALFFAIKKSKIVFFSLYTNKGFFLFPVGVVAVAVSLKAAICFLISLTALDFVTGIAASWFKKQKTEKENPPLEKTHLISSEKLKLSVAKMVMYSSAILLSHFIEKIFFIKSFNLEFSEKEFTITVFVVGFLCMIELYSVIFENFKAMGFDVLKIVSKIFHTYKTARKEIKDL